MPSITYIYDDLGRLKAVVNPLGDTGIYSYDSVGNLRSVERNSSLVVSIIEFTPKGGPSGTSVTIHGTGFSETLNENTITFNGTPATIISATATRLVTSVPSGALSGPITVTTSTGSATTTTSSFTVTGAHEAPLIATFSPTIGTIGTPVTITGAHFDTALANNMTVFNRVISVLNSATSTTIETIVPLQTGSGPIAVSTPFGRAISSADFFIPPGSHTTTDVDFTGRVERGDSKVVTIGTPDKIALVVFDGTARERLNVAVSEVNVGTDVGLFDVSILRPDGLPLAIKLMGSGDDIHTNPLPDTGTYSIVVDPVASSANINLTITVSQSVIGTITIDGPTVPVIINKPGQEARLTFEGVAGQMVNLGIVQTNVETNINVIEVSILRPNDIILAIGLAVFSGRIHTNPLPDTGTYSIVVDPVASSANINLTMSEPLTGVLLIDGPPLPITLVEGQESRLTFEGVAGQRVNLGVTEISFGTVNNVLLSILGPDETNLISTSMTDSGGTLDTDPLPDTGTYTIVVDPAGSGFDPGATTATLTLILSEPLTGAIIINGPSVPLVLNRPGQDARLSFEGTAGQSLNLVLSDVTFDIPDAVTAGEVSIQRPDGTPLASTSITSGDSNIDTDPLPETGIYMITVNLNRILNVSLNLTLLISS